MSKLNPYIQWDCTLNIKCSGGWGGLPDNGKPRAFVASRPNGKNGLKEAFQRERKK